MTRLIDDNPIRRAFSNAAMQYDMLTTLQKDIGRELLRKLDGREDCAAVLDVGMGTGYLTRKLALYFPDAVVAGLDFAPGMIDVAKGQDEVLNVVQADAEQLPFKEKTFDLIISNLAYQWIGDLHKAFGSCYRVLKKEGTFAFTMFGYNTLKELFAALEKCRGTACPPRPEPSARPGRAPTGNLPIRRLPDADRVKSALQAAGFRKTEIRSETITMHFEGMMSLLQWLKETGANALPKEVYVGREWLERADAYYREHFKDRFGVSATFEVLWVRAEK